MMKLMCCKSFSQFKFFCFLLILILFIFSNASLAHDDEKVEQISVNEKLSKSVPLNSVFIDEYGKQYTLKNLINNKPTVITMIYYTCPSLCNVILKNIADTVSQIDLKLGQDYSLLIFSINSDDDYKLAMQVKKEYSKMFPSKDWKILTGDQKNILKLANSLGISYKKEKDGSYTHPSVLIFISPQGKITRYMYGSFYLPLGVKLSLIEAGKGNVGPGISNLVEFCFNYNPKSRKFVFDISKILGIITLIFVIGFIIFLLKANKNQ